MISRSAVFMYRDNSKLRVRLTVTFLIKGKSRTEVSRLTQVASCMNELTVGQLVRQRLVRVGPRLRALGGAEAGEEGWTMSESEEGEEGEQEAARADFGGRGNISNDGHSTRHRVVVAA